MILEILSLDLKTNGILCGDDLELEFNKVDSEELLINLNSGKDYCLDRKTGLYYHPGVTMALSEEISKRWIKGWFLVCAKGYKRMIGRAWSFIRQLQCQVTLRNFCKL